MTGFPIFYANPDAMAAFDLFSGFDWIDCFCEFADFSL